MREKARKVLWTFATTAQAMKMEARCREAGVPGRLIPLPRQVSAGCGMVWMAGPGREAALVDAAVKRYGLPVERRLEVLL